MNIVGVIMVDKQEIIRYWRAVLLLEDGSLFTGKGFGYKCTRVGEVVFTTGMVGYPEALTDPSYKGQILCFTYPLIGNYGVPSYAMVDEFGLPVHFESWSIQVSGLIVHEVCWSPSHWSSRKILHEWLHEEKVPGIYGIDTRRLVKKLREKGVMMGVLKVYDIREEEPDIDALWQMLESSLRYDQIDFVKLVSVKKPVLHKADDDKGLVVLIDCGVKLNIVRSLLRRGYSILRVPYDYPADKIMEFNPIGVVVSNGPGDPKLCKSTIKCIKDLVEYKIPTLGICLGNQLISLALGGDTYKLPYGHRGQNKPCIDLLTRRCYVTSQNHGYAVDPVSLKETGLKVWFLNADDKTVEGVRHEELPIIATQFHPEAYPGPNDTSWIFDYFVKLVASKGQSP